MTDQKKSLLEAWTDLKKTLEDNDLYEPFTRLVRDLMLAAPGKPRE